MNEAVDLAQNRRLWRLMSTYALLVVHARKEDVLKFIHTAQPPRQCNGHFSGEPIFLPKLVLQRITGNMWHKSSTGRLSLQTNSVKSLK